MKTLLTGPNAITSLVAVDADTIFTADNCVIIYEANGSYKSWVPGRDLNAFTAFEIGVGYIAIMKQQTDVTGSFSDGLPGAGKSIQISNYALTDGQPTPVIFTPPGGTPFEVENADTQSVDVNNLPPEQLAPGATITLFGGAPFTVVFSPNGQSGQIVDVEGGEAYTFDLSVAEDNNVAIQVLPLRKQNYLEVSNYSATDFNLNNAFTHDNLQLVAAGQVATFTVKQLTDAGIYPNAGLEVVAVASGAFSILQQRPAADPYRNDTITSNFTPSLNQSGHSLDDGDIKIQIFDR